MQLDFTGLNQIAAKLDFAEEQPKISPVDSAESKGEYKNTSDTQNAPQSKIEPLDAIPQLQREADARKETLQSAAAVYKRYQENIRLTEQLQAQILKGIRSQEDIYSLFLKATKALSLTVSNREFYGQTVRELPQYYPEALDAAQAAGDF